MLKLGLGYVRSEQKGASAASQNSDAKAEVATGSRFFPKETENSCVITCPIGIESTSLTRLHTSKPKPIITVYTEQVYAMLNNPCGNSEDAVAPPPPIITASHKSAQMGRSRSTGNASKPAGGGVGGGSPDSSPNPSIGGTPPTGTPPRKIWERHYRSFLSRRNQQQLSSGGDHSSSSLPSVSQQLPLTATAQTSSTASSPPTLASISAALLTPELHSKFTLVASSKRLLQRVQQEEEHNDGHADHIQQPRLSSQLSAVSIDQSISTATNISSVPFLLQPNFANKYSFRASTSPSLPHPSPPRRTQSDDFSVKGGKLFQTLYPKSPSATTKHPTLPLPQQQPHRKTKSVDELDGSKRMGQDKGSFSSSAIASPPQIRHHHSLALSPRFAMHKPPPPTASLATAVATARSSSLSASPVASQPLRPTSTITAANRTYGTVREVDDEDDVDENDEETENASSDRVMTASLILPPPAPPFKASKSTTTQPLSLAGLLSQRQEHNSSAMMSPPPPASQAQPQQHQEVATLALPSSSTSAREMKKTFTQFHNSATYAQDSISAFLGDDPSTRQGTAFLSLLQQQRSQSNDERDTGATATDALAESLAPEKHLYSSDSRSKCIPAFKYSMAAEDFSRPASAVTLYSAASSYPLETVEEHVTIHRTMRMLKPIQSPETWREGRRYLIAPAALATCSLQVLSKLSSPVAATLTPAAAAKELCSQDGITTMDGRAASNEWLAFCGSICLGEAAISYVIGDSTTTSNSNSTSSNHSTRSIASRKHLQLGRWSSCWLVLRQNYLLEFDVEQKHGVPLGYAHLQYAFSYLHADFSDSIVLEFFPSPCAQADKRVLMIKVANREDRQRWVTCLNAAAQLKVTDLYDYDRKVEFGRGRYAAVYPARRRGRDRQTYEDKLSLEGLDPKAIVKQCDCAIKIIDKNEFWKRVVKGKERADTLVREVTTQATLTAECGEQISTFVRLRGFFETANNVVLELELLDGLDLFEYVSLKGVLDETEAACITRDILTSLENMHRVGLSHRDIKPANIVMCDREKHGAYVKVGDFGMATFIGVDGLVRGRCGTPGYVAPEIFNANKHGGYDGGNADVFSTGVTLYVMLCGYEPFYGETDDELISANKEAYLEFPEGDWSSVSFEARDLVQKMMEPDPKNRISAEDALKHPWIVNGTMHPPNVATLSAGGEEPTDVHCSIS